MLAGVAFGLGWGAVQFEGEAAKHEARVKVVQELGSQATAQQLRDQETWEEDAYYERNMRNVLGGIAATTLVGMVVLSGSDKEKLSA